MVKIFESVAALEYGAACGKRAEKVMEVFIEETWKSSTVFNEKMRTVQYYSEIVLNQEAGETLPVR